MALERLKRAVARSAFLTRRLFGVRVPHPTEQGHWDFSTLILFAELKRRVGPGARVLELGTGEVGILSVALARRIPAHYLALDLFDATLDSARRVAQANGADVEFLRSDLLAAVPAERVFDITFFNPPHVPRSQSVRWRTFGEPPRVWDGGEDGLDVIRRFFAEARPRGASLGLIAIGFNRASVAETTVAAVAEENGFALLDVIRALHPGTVCFFRFRAAD